MTTNRSQSLTLTLSARAHSVPGNTIVPELLADVQSSLSSILRIFLVSASIILGIDLLIGLV